MSHKPSGSGGGDYRVPGNVYNDWSTMQHGRGNVASQLQNESSFSEPPNSFSNANPVNVSLPYQKAQQYEGSCYDDASQFRGSASSQTYSSTTFSPELPKSNVTAAEGGPQYYGRVTPTPRPSSPRFESKKTAHGLPKEFMSSHKKKWWKQKKTLIIFLSVVLVVVIAVAIVLLVLLLGNGGDGGSGNGLPPVTSTTSSVVSTTTAVYLDTIVATSVAAGKSHTCAILSDSKLLRCWGNDDNGQTNVPSSLGEVTGVA
eukprot:Nk52_evm1s1741 gene=Nk52_evmTU1s1741